MFDPQRTRKNNYRYNTRKGQVIQARRTNRPYTIEQDKVEVYKEYLLSNGLLSPPTPPKEPIVYSVAFTQTSRNLYTIWEQVYNVAKVYYPGITKKFKGMTIVLQDNYEGIARNLNFGIIDTGLYVNATTPIPINDSNNSAQIYGLFFNSLPTLLSDLDRDARKNCIISIEDNPNKEGSIIINVSWELKAIAAELATNIPAWYVKATGDGALDNYKQTTIIANQSTTVEDTSQYGVQFPEVEKVASGEFLQAYELISRSAASSSYPENPATTNYIIPGGQDPATYVVSCVFE